ncbi:MAG: hypothetical protein OQK01_10250 [Xanthomonadales bacterium]|nr:hypothetical protein [Xanthomonadales bacterium]
MSKSSPGNPNKRRAFRLVGLLAVFFGVAVSWVILAEYVLDIEREYWLRFPLYFLFIVLYWIPAWGAIASRTEDLPSTRERLLTGGGCLFVALVVFLVICLLLAILFLR